MKIYAIVDSPTGRAIMALKRELENGNHGWTHETAQNYTNNKDRESEIVSIEIEIMQPT